jgi:hypothetical protein
MKITFPTKIIILSGGLSLIAICLEWMRMTTGCSYWTFIYLPWCLLFSMYLIISLPLTVIAIFLRNNSDLFNKWFNFTRVYLLIYLFIYLLSPDEGAWLQPIYKENVALVSFFLYPVLSMIIIAIAHYKNKKSS